ncbi:hypothetical protein [Propionivibrio sp.]|uniref:hypothetical protein n=1 Tax=Propionivibrio sp. TaxID=2212460 RepID=UPI0039E5FA02
MSSNYELPNVPEDYVHRIGRTGRAGSEGAAVSLVCVDEHKLLKDIERLIKKPIDVVAHPGYEPDPSIRPEPIQVRSAGARGGQRPGGGRRGGAARATTPKVPAKTAAPAGKPGGGAARRRKARDGKQAL